MRVALVHPYPVHRQAVGGTTRVYELARYLAERHDVTVFSHADGTEEDDPDLKRLGVQALTFGRPEPRVHDKVWWWCDQTPYYVHRNVNVNLAAALAAANRDRPFDVVHAELAYMAPALSGLDGRAVRVLAEQEVMTLVIERLRRVPWRRRTMYERMFAATAAKVEQFDRRALREFDLLYGITPRERDELRRLSGRPVAVLPHIVSMARFAGDPVDDGRTTVLFVGNFGHGPNVHGARWFVDEVWPRIRAQVPAATFEIVGAGLTETLRSKLSSPGVVVTGYVPDLARCYRRVSVVVTPVHSGGGMRGKVLEAFASAKALVSTSTGLEGIAAVPGVHCRAADTPAGFAEAVVAYLGAPDMRRAHGLAARSLVAAHYDARVVFGRLEHEYERAVAARRARAVPA